MYVSQPLSEHELGSSFLAVTKKTGKLHCELAMYQFDAHGKPTTVEAAQAT